MLEYARIFAYRTDMNLIGHDGRTDGRTDNPALQERVTPALFKNVMRSCQWPGGQLLLTMICETKLLFQLTGENLPKFESSH
jgi:hypothetical protein